jgi:repressor LexA
VTQHPPLTHRQRQILEYIRAHLAEKGYPPTVRAIAAHFGIRSPNGARCHLLALERKGLLRRQRGKARAIRLAESPPLSLPVLEIPLAPPRP